MKIPQKHPYFLIFVIIGLIFLWFLAGIFLPDKANKIKHVKEDVISVRVITSHAQNYIAGLTVRGHTEANRRVTLRAEVSGPIQEIVVEKGSTVTKGTELVQLDPQDREQALIEAEALLKQRTLEFEASRKLALKSFQSQTRLAEARALLKKAESILAQVNLALKNTHIQAPFDGVFESHYVEKGDYVAVGDKIGMIVELDPLKIVCQVAEADIHHVHAGIESMVRFADGTQLSAYVAYVGVVAKEETRTFPVELTLPNPDYLIRDGLTAEVYIPTGPVKAHKVSPAILSLNDEGIVGVKIVDDQSRVSFRPIQIIDHKNEGLWITGLPDQANVIIAGQEFVKDKQEVKGISE